MWKYIIVLLMLSTSVMAKPSNFFCRFDNGQSVEGWAKDGDIMLDFDGKGDWNKAYGRIDGKFAIITEIVSGGMFTLTWEYEKHSAYGITKHNNGRTTEGNAYCSWR
jgi:hypothetical protein